MATKSVEKPTKKAPAAKTKPEKKPVANVKESAQRRPQPAAAKQAARPAQQTGSKPTIAVKPPAPKPAAKSAQPKAPARKAAAPKASNAKSAPAKSAAKAKAPPSKSAASKAPPKKVELKKPAPAPKAPDKKAAAKPAAAKAAPSKSSKTEQPDAKLKKPAEETAKSKAPAPKAQPDKKAADRAPVDKKSDVKGAPKGSPEPQTDAAGKKSGGKATKSSGAAKTMTESPAMKKPLVGQKPRSDRPASMSLGAPLTFMPKANQSVNESTVKPSPASQEAKLDFKVNDHVVYPAHGVGRIVGIERQVIAGIVNELFLIDFEQEKMKLRVPTAKAKAVGMRALSDPALVKKALETLKGRARIKRTMWSRRAQEYEAKINSGDIISVAEVVRDLFRASDQPEQSYSERQLFEAALDRLAREVAAVHKSDLAAALTELEGALQQKKAA